MHSDHGICFKVEIQIVIYLFWNWKKRGRSGAGVWDYILVRSSCIYILQHDTNVSMYLDGVTVMSFVLKKAISIQYILYLLSAPTHQAAGAIAGGELGICLSPARTIMGVRQ